MFKKLNVHIGPRIIKTSVSAALSMLITQALNIEFPALAVVAAVIILQPTFHETLEMSKRRIIGTIIGCILGILCIYLLPVHETIEVLLGVMVILTLSNTFSLANSSILGVIAFVSIITMPDASYLTALNRLVTTVIGAGTSILMNFIFPVQPIVLKSNEIIKDTLAKEMDLLNDALKQITGKVEICSEKFTQTNDDIIKQLNEAFTIRQLLQKEQKFAVSHESYMAFDEKYNALWVIHNSVSQIQNDKDMLISGDAELPDGVITQVAELTALADDILNGAKGIPKGTKKKLDICIEKMEKSFNESHCDVTYGEAYLEGGFFAIMITNLKRIAENIIIFEISSGLKRG